MFEIWQWMCGNSLRWDIVYKITSHITQGVVILFMEPTTTMASHCSSRLGKEFHSTPTRRFIHSTPGVLLIRGVTAHALLISHPIVWGAVGWVGGHCPGLSRCYHGNNALGSCGEFGRLQGSWWLLTPALLIQCRHFLLPVDNYD